MHSCVVRAAWWWCGRGGRGGRRGRRPFFALFVVVKVRERGCQYGLVMGCAVFVRDGEGVVKVASVGE